MKNYNTKKILRKIFGFIYLASNVVYFRCMLLRNNDRCYYCGKRAVYIDESFHDVECNNNNCKIKCHNPQNIYKHTRMRCKNKHAEQRRIDYGKKYNESVDPTLFD